MTGTLPDDATFPATVTIPIPEAATINAIARVDEQGAMFTDVESDDSVSGLLTLTLESPTFRIEYYDPYSSDGNDRQYTFDWQSEIGVNELAAIVQQPSSASNMTISPEDVGVTTQPDGLLYHNLPVQKLAAGESFTIDIGYTMLRPQLSAELLTGQPTSAPVFTDEQALPSAAPGSDFNWPLIAAAMAVVLAIAAAAWLIVNSQQKKKRVVKPRPIRSSGVQRSSSSAGKPSSRANFCHECGQPVAAEDKFCRNCGTALKGA